MIKYVLFLFLLLAPPLSAESFQKIVEHADRAMARTVMVDNSGNPRSTGSGFVVSKGRSDNSYFYVTNNHVIHGKHNIAVVFQVGNQRFLYDGRVHHAAPQLDLAVIEITPTERFNHTPGFLALAGREIEKGENVAALGYPSVADEKLDGLSDPAFFETTLTQGAVSKVYVGPWYRGQGKLEIVQHTAAVNYGNSGGPLLSSCGNVVGVNTQISVPEGQKPKNDTYWSSSSNVLIKYLNTVDVDFHKINRPCDGTFAGLPGSNAKWGNWVYITLAIVATFAAIGLFVALMMYRKRKGPAAPASRPTSFEAARRSRALLAARTDAGDTFDLTSAALKAGVLIGRAPEAGMRVSDKSLSRHHAKMQINGRKLTLVDLGSTNGTYVDGCKLSANAPVQITTRSELRFGDVIVRLNRPGG